MVLGIHQKEMIPKPFPSGMTRSCRPRVVLIFSKRLNTMVDKVMTKDHKPFLGKKTRYSSWDYYNKTIKTSGIC